MELRWLLYITQSRAGIARRAVGVARSWLCSANTPVRSFRFDRNCLPLRAFVRRPHDSLTTALGVIGSLSVQVAPSFFFFLSSCVPLRTGAQDRWRTHH